MSSSWTPKPHFCGGDAYYRIFFQITLLVTCVILLSGCGQFSPFSDDDSDTRAAPAVAAQDTDSFAQPPLTAPPVMNERPGQIETTGPPQTIEERLNEMHPAMGVKAKPLFAKRLDNPDARLDRLEYAVQELRNDLNFMSPAVLKLVALEDDIQGLIGQIEELLVQEPPAPASAAAPVSDPVQASAADSNPLPLSGPAQPEPVEELPETAQTVPPAVTEKAEPPSQKPTKPSDGKTQVYDLRVGEHTDKTRLVLDVSAQTSYSTDLDNMEKLLVVELPEAAWSAPENQEFQGSPVLSSYRVESVNNGQGSLLVLQLKRPATLLFSGKLPATSGKGQRIVIDLGGAPAQ